MTESSNAKQTDRRSILKLGVATGVGVAAWAGPGVGILGTSPAYAAVCSGTVQSFDSTWEPSNQGGSCGSGASETTTITKLMANLNGLTGVTTSGICADGVSTITVTTGFVNASCILRIYQRAGGNGAGSVIATNTVINPAGGTVSISVPTVLKSSGNASSQFRFTVICTDDDDVAVCTPI